jgi:hypothetical protein
MRFYRRQPSLVMLEEAMTESFDAKKMTPLKKSAHLKG